MKTRNDCEIACDCVKRANVVLHVDLCKEIFARKQTATHKPTSAQPVHMCHDDTHTPNNRLWSPLAYGLGGNKISLQATETEESIWPARQQGLWKPTTTLTPALNADSIPRKKSFVFLVASAIEASSRRKTVSFTSSIPLESDKKNAHGQRRAISVRGTSFHSETGLGLWVKRKPFPHLRTEARSKRNRRVPIETRRGPIEATARQASVRESHSRTCNPKHGANETRRVPIEATARQASVFG